MQLEMFVHGALCMSVSGQCYLSAMIGGRSGNRGLCAQPCRLPFSADKSGSCDLSLKDLSLVRRLAAIESAGVFSLKIEGRMKRPEYVAAAVNAVKSAINGNLDEKMNSICEAFSAAAASQAAILTANWANPCSAPGKRRMWFPQQAC